MNKKFFEVFPTLKVNEELELLFHGVDVCKVATKGEITSGCRSAVDI